MSRHASTVVTCYCAICACITTLHQPAAWRDGLERRFYDDHDRKANGSTPNLVSLLRSCIRCFTMIICLVRSDKQQIKVGRKFNRKAWKQRQVLSESGFILGMAPPPLSRDRRIKMKKSINHLMFSMYSVLYALLMASKTVLNTFLKDISLRLSTILFPALSRFLVAQAE